jgi:hypothetical protein
MYSSTESRSTFGTVLLSDATSHAKTEALPKTSGTLLARKLTPVGKMAAEAITSLSLDLIALIEEYVVSAAQRVQFRLQPRLWDTIQKSHNMVVATDVDFLREEGGLLTCLNLVIPATSKDYQQGAVYSRKTNGFAFRIWEHLMRKVTEHCPNLERLDILCSKETARLFVKRTGQPGLPKLTHLGLDIPHNGDLFNSSDFEELAKEFSSLKLESLAFEHCAEDAIGNIQHFDKLKELTLYKLPERAQWEKLSQHPTLLRLNLVGINADEMGYMIGVIPNVFACFPRQLETLTLERCSVLPFTTENFFTPSQSLKTIVFKECGVNDAEQRQIRASLKETKPRLEVEFL